MPIPQLTDEERKVALDKARESRAARAEVREKLKNGEYTLKQVIDMRDDDVIGRMKVSVLIETLPGYGKAKTERIMEELKISPNRRIRGLGDRQLKDLLDRLG